MCATRQAPPSDDAPGLNNGYTLLHTHTHTQFPDEPELAKC